MVGCNGIRTGMRSTSSCADGSQRRVVDHAPGRQRCPGGQLSARRMCEGAWAPCTQARQSGPELSRPLRPTRQRPPARCRGAHDHKRAEQPAYGASAERAVRPGRQCHRDHRPRVQVSPRDLRRNDQHDRAARQTHVTPRCNLDDPGLPANLGERGPCTHSMAVQYQWAPRRPAGRPAARAPARAAHVHRRRARPQPLLDVRRKTDISISVPSSHLVAEHDGGRKFADEGPSSPISGGRLLADAPSSRPPS